MFNYTSLVRFAGLLFYFIIVTVVIYGAFVVVNIIVVVCGQHRSIAEEKEAKGKRQKLGRALTCFKKSEKEKKNSN